MRKIILLVLFLSLVVLSGCNKMCLGSSSWDFDDTKHWRVCDKSGQTFDIEEHEITWTVKTAATCEVELVENGVCICGYTTTRTGSTIEHDLQNVAGKAATCTETGLTEGKKCSICDEVLVEQVVLPALGHTPLEPVIENRVESTCVLAGHCDLVVYCGVCDEELSRETKTLELKEHTLETLPSKAVTCTERGLTEGKKCSVCDAILVEQVVLPALGHTPLEPIIENRVESTCVVAGHYDLVVYCGVCSEELSRETKALELKEHTLETLPSKAATCTETGLTEGKKCSACGEIIEAQEVTPALGHTPLEAVVENRVESICTVAGRYDLVVYCGVCGEELSREIVTVPADEHSYEAVVTAPTPYEQGYTTYTCSVCGDSYVDDYVAALGVAQIGDVKYPSLAAAIEAAQAGDIITLLAGAKEDVTVNKSITIDGAEFKYTGNIAVTGKTVSVTIKNVNFENGTGYAITTNTVKSITVENCTVNNYGYGFLYANKSTTTVVVKNVTVNNANYGFHWVYGSKATLENVTMNNVETGLFIQNYAGKTITLTGCDITSIIIWERDGQSGVQTFNFKGANTVANLDESEYAKYVLAATDATLTAPLGAEVTTSVPGYAVAYEEGTYSVVEAIAQIGDAYYGAIQAAINAAQDGDVITVVADHEVKCDVNPLISVAGKNITIDLNGKAITVNAVNAENTIRIVFNVAEDAELTMTDSVGTGVVVANGEGVIYYMFRNEGTTTINGGNYELSAFDGGAIFFSTNGNMTVNGGDFVQVTNGWMFNTQGNGGFTVTVNGGTFNRNFIGGEDCNENPYGEVVITDGKGLHKIGENTWQVVEHIAGNTIVENRIESTCDAAGHYDLVVYCDVCDEELSRETKELELKEHIIEILPAKAANCAESGLTEGKICIVCNKIIEAQEVIQALGHNIIASHYEDKINELILVEKCSRCGTFYTSIDKTKSINVTTYKDLETILAMGYHAYLTKSVDLPKAIVIGKNAKLTIASNVVITLSNDTVGDGAFRVIKGATFIIDGKGKINGVGNNVYNMALWANGGHIIINGGTFTNVGAKGNDPNHFDLIYVSGGGSVTINGGTFIAETPKWTLNIKDDDTVGTFVVNGGTFHGYNPAEVQTEPVGRNNNFLGEDCISYVGANGVYTVAKTTSITEALEIGSQQESNAYTKEKYILTGTITSVENATYGNVIITDGTNSILIYGLYSVDGKNRYDAMGYKPIKGDVITVTGVLGRYYDTRQMKDAWLLSCIPHTHEYTEATCTAPSKCTICDEIKAEALGHNYLEGECTNCGAEDPSVGDVELITASKTIKELITKLGWTSNTTKQTFNLDENVTVKINGGSNTGKAYDGDHIRIYATDSPAGTITITVPEGYELVSVKISTQTGTYAFLSVNDIKDVCNKTVGIYGNSVVLKTVKNGDNGKQVRVTAIEVVYQAK